MQIISHHAWALACKDRQFLIKKKMIIYHSTAMTSLLILDKIIKDIELECPICYDQITSCIDLVCSSCCKNFFHLSCFKHSGNISCQMCENRSPAKLTPHHIDFIIELAKKFGTEHISNVIVEWSGYRIKDARVFDHKLKEELGVDKYVSMFGGCYNLPAYCRFIKREDLAPYALYTPGELVWCSKEQFSERFEEFTHGILKGFKWPEGLVVAGLTIPAILGAKNYEHAYESPTMCIDMVAVRPDFDGIKEIVGCLREHLESTVGDIVHPSYAIRKNMIYIKIANIRRVIKLELVCGNKCYVPSMYKVMTSYGMSNYEMCQAFYDGKEIKMTVKAIASYTYQSTYMSQKTVAKQVYDQLQTLGYSANSTKAANLSLFQIPPHSQFSEFIDYRELQMHTLPQEPILIVEIRTHSKSLLMEQTIHKVLSQVRENTGIAVEIKKDAAFTTDVKAYIKQGDRTIPFENPGIASKALCDFVWRSHVVGPKKSTLIVHT